MGAQASVEIDAALRQGGLVVTSSERAARALASAFHRARQAEGLTAWPSPNIQDWKTFVRTALAARTLDGRILLNSTQEQSLWAAIAASAGHMATLLPGPLHRIAAMAIEAHELLCSHAPRLLRASTRSGWQNDPAAFSSWLAAFDETCRSADLLSPARLPLELVHLLESPSPATSQLPRSPLLLVGFDRMTPIHRSLFDAWGQWREAPLGEPAPQIHFHQAPDEQAELAACVLWSAQLLAANPNTRILVVTQNIAASSHRGQLERAFLKFLPQAPTASPLFEFSLGVPLSQVSLPRAGHLLLRWLSGPLAELELDWLLSSGRAAATPQESSALQAHMRAIRRRSLEQPQWTIDA